MYLFNDGSRDGFANTITVRSERDFPRLDAMCSEDFVLVVNLKSMMPFTFEPTTNFFPYTYQVLLKR